MYMNMCLHVPRCFAFVFVRLKINLKVSSLVLDLIMRS